MKRQNVEEVHLVAQIPDNISSLIRTYVGLLIGNHDLSVYSYKTISADEIPVAMQDERNVLRAIESCIQDGVPAEAHFVEQKLSVNNWQVSKDAVTVMASAVDSGWRGNTTNSLKLASSVIKQWLFETEGIQYWQRASQIMADQSLGSYEQRYQEAHKLAIQVSPTVENLSILTDEELVDGVLKDYDEKRRILLEEGKFPVPVPHLTTLASLGVTFEDGEFTLVLGNEGTGKSSFLQQLGAHVAEKQGIGYDVLYLSLETSKRILGYRRLAQECGIPTDDFMSFRVDTKSAQFLEVYNSYIKKRRQQEESSGYLRYAVLHDKSVNGIIDAINKAYFVTSAAKRKLLVILDHIGRIDKPDTQGSNDANRISDAIVKIANACNAINSHIIFVGHLGKDGKLFGATEGNKKAQQVIVLEAGKPEGGVSHDIVATDALGRNMADYLGRPRYFQRVGNTYGCELTARIEKSNNTGGGYVKFNMERPMGSKCYDIPSEMERLMSAKNG